MCVYRTEDGLCKKYSNEEVTSYCVDGPCPDEVLTNADRIRAMSDDELVAFLDDLTCLCVDCHAQDGKNKNCPIYNKGCGRYCEPKDLMNWLRQQAEED